MIKGLQLVVIGILLGLNTIANAQDWLPFGSDATFGTSISTGVYDITVSGINTYVAGGFHTSDGNSTYDLVAYWNGSFWNQMGSGFSSGGKVYSIVEYNGSFYIGGEFTYDDGTNPSFTNFGKWNGSHWEAVGTGPDAAVNVLYEYGGNLYVGGEFTSIGGVTTNSVAKFDGTNWSILGSGGVSSGGVVSSMVAYGGDLIVAGDFSTADDGNIFVRNAAAFDGTNWSRLGGNDIDGGGGTSSAILDMEVFDGSLYVGGEFTSIYNGLSATSVSGHIGTWTGTVWSVPAKQQGGLFKVNALTVFDGNLYAGSSDQTTIYSWNGSPIYNWEFTNTPQKVNTLYNTSLYVFFGGNYSGIYFFADPAPAFSSVTEACPGQEVTFTDNSVSTNTITAWNWVFQGGTPATSTDQNPVVVFASAGTYDVTLAVTSSDGTNSKTFNDYITIADEVEANSLSATTISECSGQDIDVTITSFSGTGNETFQWQMNTGSGFVDLENVSGEIANVAGTTLYLYNVPFDYNGATLRCVVTNECGSSANSPEATLDLTQAPEITETSGNRTVCETGDDVTLSVTATNATSYQWQYYTGPSTYSDLSDSGPYSGTATATLSITNANNTTILGELYDADFSDGKTNAYYRCVMTGNSCTTETGLYNLTIYAEPTITENPIDVEECDTGSGVDASFSVTASPDLPNYEGSYQWMVDDGSGYVDVVDDDVYAGATSSTLNLTAATSILSGNKYKCLVGSTCTSPQESSEAMLTINDKPVLVQNLPVGPIYTCTGVEVTLTTDFSGSNLSYQWQVKPEGSSVYTDIANDDTYFTTDGVLQITPNTSLYGSYYRCVVSSGFCDVNNEITNTGQVQLRVFDEPTLTAATSSSSLAVCEGGSTTLQVVPNSSSGTAFSNGTYTYQWQVDITGEGIFSDITEGDIYSVQNSSSTSLLTINDATISMNGYQYRCVAKGCTSDIPSEPETLIVNQLPLVTNSPVAQIVCVGDEVTLSATATGTDVSYLWYYSSDGTNYSEATFGSFYGTSDMTITSAITDYNGFMFKCVVSSASPCTQTAETEPVMLTVNQTSISTASGTTTTCAGDNAEFSVVAEGESLTYQWFENDTAITDGGIYSGATTTTLTLTGVGIDKNGAEYKCVVSGSCPDATSNTYPLSVSGVDKPEITANFTSPTQPVLFVSNVSGDNYEWFKDSSLYSSGSSSLTISEEGSYTVVVYLSGCASEESDAQVILITSLGDELLDKIQAYPNPVKDELTIRLSQMIGNTTIKVLSLDGKVQINQIATEKDNKLNMSNLRQGTYLVQVSNPKKTLVYKVIKQ